MDVADAQHGRCVRRALLAKARRRAETLFADSIGGSGDDRRRAGAESERARTAPAGRMRRGSDADPADRSKVEKRWTRRRERIFLRYCGRLCQHDRERGGTGHEPLSLQPQAAQGAIRRDGRMVLSGYQSRQGADLFMASSLQPFISHI